LGPAFPRKGRALLLGEEEKKGSGHVFIASSIRENQRGRQSFSTKPTQRCHAHRHTEKRTARISFWLVPLPLLPVSPDSTFSNFLDLAELFIANGLRARRWLPAPPAAGGGSAAKDPLASTHRH